MTKILISACLLGRPVRYDGRGKRLDHQLIEQWQAEGRLVSVCPEILAGFPTPRPPAEIQKGWDGVDVLAGGAAIFEDTGRDVTQAFINGAHAALKIAKEHDCRFALLTDGSPSCGSTFIYDGGFRGRRKSGAGAVAALLQQNGIEVFAESRIADLASVLGRFCGVSGEQISSDRTR